MFVRMILLALTLHGFLSPLSVQAEEKIKIGFLLKTMQEDRYPHDKRFFEERAKSLGVDVRFDSANNDSELQFKQFSDLLAQGCQVIVLQPVKTEQAEKMVRMAHLRGVKVVGYDSLLTGGPLDVMVMQDSWQVGREQGQALEKWLQDKQGEVNGKIALIMGQPDDNNAMTMSVGLCETVGADEIGMCKKIKEKFCPKEHDNCELNLNENGVGTKNPKLTLVVAEEHVAWSDDPAAKTTSTVLKEHPDTKAFLCNNSRMARGVIRTLKNEGLDLSKIFVAGSDADLANVRMVVKSEQNLEIYKKIKPLAETAVAIAVALAKDPTTKVDKSFLKPFVNSAECPECYDKEVDNGYAKIPTIITPVVPITKDNGNIEIPIAEGIYTREQVYNK